MEKIDHFEPRFRWVPVHRSHRGQAVELLLMPEKGRDRNDVFRVDQQRGFAACQRSIEDRVRVSRNQGCHGGPLLQLIGKHFRYLLMASTSGLVSSAALLCPTGAGCT